MHSGVTDHIKSLEPKARLKGIVEAVRRTLELLPPDEHIHALTLGRVEERLWKSTVIISIR